MDWAESLTANWDRADSHRGCGRDGLQGKGSLDDDGEVTGGTYII